MSSFSLWSLNSFLILYTAICFGSEVNSQCFGTTSSGSLKDGVKLPAEGNNFVAYSTTARIAGRTYVHSSVRDILIAAYKALEKEQPRKVYK